MGKRGVSCDPGETGPGRSRLRSEFISAVTGCCNAGTWSWMLDKISKMGAMVRLKSWM